MPYKKFFILSIMVLLSLFVYTKSIGQTTPEQWRQIRLNREAEESRRRQQQQSQEADRLKKNNTNGYKPGETKTNNQSPNKTSVTDNNENDGMHYVIFDEVSTANRNGLRRVKRDMRFGFINAQGVTVIPVIYNDASITFSGIIVGVKKGNAWGFVNTKGETVLPFQYDKITEFKSNWARVEKNGMSGFITDDGNVLLECLYEEINFITKDISIVKVQNKYGVLHFRYSLPMESLKPIYDSIGYLAKPNYQILICKRNNLYGIIGTASAVYTVDCKYDKIPSFSEEGLAVISMKNKKGIVNVHGREIAPMKYDDIILGDDMSAVKSMGKWGFVNNAGKLALAMQYDKVISGFFNGRAQITKEGITSYINREGKKIAATTYIKDGKEISSARIINTGKYYTELYLFFDNSFKRGFKDSEVNGNIIVPAIYTDHDGFSEGLAAVKDSLLWGFIDLTGQIAIPLIYQQTSGAFHDKVVGVKSNGQWGCIDDMGKMVIPFSFSYQYIGRLKEGLMSAKKNDLWGCIDKAGTVHIPFIYRGVSEFTDGIAIANKDGKMGYIDKTGTVKIPFIYDKVGYYSDGFASYSINSQSGFINKEGTQIIPPLYEDVMGFTEGFFWFYVRGKYGFGSSKDGTVIVEPTYEAVKEYFKNGKATVRLTSKDKFIVIDTKGKIVE